MTRKTSRTAAVLAGAAALSMLATPALARDRGWGGGWGGGYGRHHNDGVSAGDVLAGVLIIGGIAAIASAASKNKQRTQAPEYRDPEYRGPDYRGPDYRGNDARDYGQGDERPEWRDGAGIDTAVNRCVDEVSRGDSRADRVESVNRDGDGWRVQGRTASGGTFACAIDGDGRIRTVNIDGRAI